MGLTPGWPLQVQVRVLVVSGLLLGEYTMATKGIPAKRIILCLDGTWVNSDKGYNPPTLDQPNATLQVPSNVTRLYRSLKKRDQDGTGQVLYYQPGVGSTGGIADSIAGGAFGIGVSEVGPHTVF